MSNDLLNWLMGVVETNPDGLDAKQVEVIRAKLEAEISQIVKGKFERERAIAEMKAKEAEYMDTLVVARAVTGVSKVALGRPVIGTEEAWASSGTGLTRR